MADGVVLKDEKVTDRREKRIRARSADHDEQLAAHWPSLAIAAGFAAAGAAVDATTSRQIGSRRVSETIRSLRRKVLD